MSAEPYEISQAAKDCVSVLKGYLSDGFRESPTLEIITIAIELATILIKKERDTANCEALALREALKMAWDFSDCPIGEGLCSTTETLEAQDRWRDEYEKLGAKVKSLIHGHTTDLVAVPREELEALKKDRERL